MRVAPGVRTRGQALRRAVAVERRTAFVTVDYALPGAIA